MRGAYTRALLSLVLLTVGPALAEPDSFYLGDGKDGAPSFGNTAKVINSYAQVKEPLAPGDMEISISPKADVKPGDGRTNDNAFKAEDLVLVIQTTGIVPQLQSRMSDPLDLGASDVGRWEFARLASATMSWTGSKLELKAPLTQAYAEGVTQVIRVPEYTSVTLNHEDVILKAEPWDASKGYGGIIAFLSKGDVTLTKGQIVAEASGFRGGQFVLDWAATACPANQDSGDSPSHAQKGEGVDNTRYTLNPGEFGTGRGNLGNGGGGGICVRSGGGGGGNAGFGGKGGRTAETTARDAGGYGGVPLVYSMLERLTFGGGGGSGHGRNAITAPLNHSDGGRGGGIVFIRAANVTLTDTNKSAIRASGADGRDGGGDGAGGGGAGGTVLLRLTGNLSCSAKSIFWVKGGNGGASTTDIPPVTGGGGGGGGGRVLYQANNAESCLSLSEDSVAGGSGGGNGTTDGKPGVITKLPGAFPNLSLSSPQVNGPSGLTNQRRPTIVGKAQAHRQVIIYLNGVEVGQVYAEDDGDFAFPLPQNLSDGEYKATAAIRYQGVYSPRSSERNFTVDGTPPPSPLIDTLGEPTPVPKPASEGMLIGKPDLTYNSSTGKYELTISGRSEKGATKGALVTVQQLKFDDSPFATASFDDTSNTGNWSVKIAQVDEQALTTYKLKVTATDAAGNLNIAPATLTFKLDTKAPAAPLVTKVAGMIPVGPTGTCSAASYPFITTQLPLIEGTAEPRSTVIATLARRSAPASPHDVAQVQANNSTGYWSSAPISALPEQNEVYTLTLTVKDEAGNPSPASIYCFALDVKAPPNPSIDTLGTPGKAATEGMLIGKPALALNSSSGKYELTISGKAERGAVKGSIVTVRQLKPDGTEFAKVSFDDTNTNTGNWSVKIAQLDGQPLTAYKLEVTTKDVAGNTSAPTTLTFNLDTQAPAAPSVAKVAGVEPARTTGTCTATSLPFITTQLPLIEGTAEARSTVIATLVPKSTPSTSYEVSQTQANGTPGSMGNWSSGPISALPKPNDVYTLTVTVKDEAGNPSPASTYCFTLDATAPAPLTLSTTTLGNQTAAKGMLIGLAGLTPDGKLRISGSAEPASTVVLKLIPLDPTKEVDESASTVTAAGAWWHDWSGKESGAYGVEARVKDEAGNQSDPLTIFFELDLIRPSVTLSGRPTESSTTASRDMAFGFSTSERVDTYECTLNDQPVSCANPFISTVDKSGTYQFKVWVTDPAGNKSLETAAATRNWTVDTDQPIVFILNQLSIPHGGGATQQQDITFQLRANKEGLDIYCQKDLDSEEWKKPCVCNEWIPAPDGKLPRVCVKTYSGLPEGSHVFVVKAHSPTTNAETSENERQKNEWVVDRTKPDTFITEKPGDWVAVNYVTVKFTATAESQTPNFQCELTRPTSTEVVKCTTSNSHLMSNLSDGAYTLRIKAIDLAGNEEEKPAVVSWTVDTQGPDAPVLQVPREGRRYKDLVLTGSAIGEPFSSIAAYLDDPEGTGTPIGTTTTNGSGEWQLSVAAEHKPEDGNHSITLKATDRAGNPGVMSVPVNFFMDNQPPTVQINGPEKNSLNRTATFHFTTNEEGVTFQCKLDLQDPVDCGTEVSFSDLEQGPHTLNVYAVDEAGNRREIGYSWSVYLGRDIRAEGGGLGCSATSAQTPALWLLGLLGLLRKKASRHSGTNGNRN